MTLTASAPHVNLSKGPKVGDGVSFVYGSDREPGTVTAVQLFKSGARVGRIRRIQVAYDSWRIVSGNFRSNNAVIEYERNEDSPLMWLTQDANGRWRMSGGNRVIIGRREYYQDPHF